jgi:hypothetical protein
MSFKPETIGSDSPLSVGAENKAASDKIQQWNSAVNEAQQQKGIVVADTALACRGVTGSLGAATHCGLFVYDGANPATANVREQFSLGGNQTRFNTAGSTNRWDLQAFRNNQVHRINPPQGTSQERFDDCVINEARSYQADSYSAFWGPNSNSAAAFPLIQCGGQPPNVSGAVAIDYWRHHNYRRNP